MKITKNWVRRRWMDFRAGYGVYIAFFVGFCNFILLFFNFFILRYNIQINFALFVVLAGAVIVILGVLMGHWHNTTQLGLEQVYGMLQNPFNAQIMRVILQSIKGEASRKELDDLISKLRSVEVKPN